MTNFRDSLFIIIKNDFIVIKSFLHIQHLNFIAFKANEGAIPLIYAQRSVNQRHLQAHLMHSIDSASNILYSL